MTGSAVQAIVARRQTEVREGERRIRYGWVWLLFLGSLFVGAGLLLNPDASTRAWGLVLLLLPLAGVGLLLAAYYLKSRGEAGRDA